MQDTGATLVHQAETLRQHALAADSADLSYVTVAVRDTASLTVPDAMNALLYEIAGPGEIVALDNGDPTTSCPYKVQTEARHSMASHT